MNRMFSVMSPPHSQATTKTTQPKSTPAGSSRPDIGTLTALRFIAALWVVLFHLQALRQTFLAPVYDLFGPVIANGDLGVDVFFVLSGFIITYTYLDRLGPQFRWRAAGDFVWARFARMWPAFALVVGVLGLWFVYGTAQENASTWSLQTQTPDLSPWGLAKQLLMVHLWFQPTTDGASWFGPGWTVSAEWLAYLAFPLLALPLFRLRTLHPLAAMAASIVVLLPTAAWGPDLPVDSGAQPFHWLLRIACCFTSGAFACLATRNADRLKLNPALAGRGAVLLGTAVVIFLALAGKPGPGRLAVLAFPLLIALLSLARGRLNAALSARWLQFGGRSSYSLYLVHMFFIYLFYWINRDWPAGAAPLMTNLLAAACLLEIAFGTWVMFKFVEEPARKRLRSMVPRPVYAS
ncbi:MULTISPECIES: acyltransferase [Arthrobacter]|uniref:Acyltransferase n=1 Tax=Arthrobacter terricola TaxID=2547396 RepID=A0A4R5KHP1_9MICC|nr:MULTISPECIES: acyltransferase [Arthrobacter]MBT8159188.1 acyltransferase [Arthrobacter sp. GN70]TDF94971.1 acyltransferase [Arthrobacter terricola]